jgi:hypothetical protein
MEPTEAIKLSKREALSIFCFLEIGYSSVLEQKLEIVKNTRDYSLLPELKYLFLVLKIWKCYKSEKIRDIAQDTMELFIKDIYRDENRRLSMTDLKFMIPFVFSFRNVRSQKAMKQTNHSENYVRYFQQKFQELAHKEKQLSLF